MFNKQPAVGQIRFVDQSPADSKHRSRHHEQGQFIPAVLTLRADAADDPSNRRLSTVRVFVGMSCTDVPRHHDTPELSIYHMSVDERFDE